ncbi:MAG: histidine phosphatase family protein [bacterium]|nr:histidine phosphatase family protein [Gammaproteobacteria bacterium]HIL96797.1 histidine phosphatase family protein [Pseudomonadales bacterium]
MGKIRLIVLRHGETDHNRIGRYQGTVDTPLNETGRAQAASAVDYLRLQGIDHILSSPQARAWETAEIVGTALGLKVTPDPAFVERNFGVFEGKTREEIASEYPELLRENASRQIHASMPGGESLFELATRVHTGVREIQRLYSDVTMLLVCHGGALRALHGVLRRATDQQYFSYQLANGEMDDYILAG